MGNCEFKPCTKAVPPHSGKHSTSTQTTSTQSTEARWTLTTPVLVGTCVGLFAAGAFTVLAVQWMRASCRRTELPLVHRVADQDIIFAEALGESEDQGLVSGSEVKASG